MARLRQYISSPWFGMLALAALVLLAYYNAFHGGFLFDDEFLVERNRFLRSWASLPEIFTSSSTGGAGHIDSFYRPLQGFLYLIVYQLSGFRPVGFHALNIFIHMANAVLLYLLGRKLGWHSVGVWLGAAIWAVHPVHTEAISYVSATADPLYALACLAGVYVLLPDFSPRRVFASVMIFALGLLSKESAIVLAALAPVMFFYASPRRLEWRGYLRFWPHWLLAALYLLARKTILNFNDSFSFYKTSNIYTESIVIRSYTFLATLPSYLKLLILPSDLHMDRSFPIFTSPFVLPVALGSTICLVLLGVLLYGRGRRVLLGSFAILWFAAAHAPHMGVLLPVNSLFLEHWLYLPSMVLFLACLHSLASVKHTKQWLTGVALFSLIIIGCEIYATQQQNLVWQNPVRFYQNILAHEAVGSARVHNNLAMALSSTDPKAAIEHYQRAIAIEDHYPQTHHNLALLLLMDGQTESGIRELKRAVELNAGFFYSYQVLAQVYAQLGDKTQADYYAKQFELTRGKFGQ